MSKRGANFDVRLERVEEAVRSRLRPGGFTVVQALSVERAPGMVPGLYPIGPPGSTSGLLVYDPVRGRALPANAGHPMLIEVEGATLGSIL